MQFMSYVLKFEEKNNKDNKKLNKIFVLFINIVYLYLLQNRNVDNMKNTLLSIWNFYIEGFRSMTLGRTLWLIILIKLFVMFFILKLFFFPDFLAGQSKGAGKETYVGNELIQRAAP